MGWESAGGGELMGWGVLQARCCSIRSRINLGVDVQSDHQDEMYFSVLLYSRLVLSEPYNRL